MLNLFISSIEIELINELFYLKTKRLRSVFRVTLRLRTGYRLRVFKRLFSPLEVGLLSTMGGTSFGLTDRKAQFTLLETNLTEKATQTSRWYEQGRRCSLERSWLFHPRACMHAIACYSHHVLLGGPLLSPP